MMSTTTYPSAREQHGQLRVDTECRPSSHPCLRLTISRWIGYDQMPMSAFRISPLFLALVFGLILPQAVGASDNGLASEPLRGWSSWSCFMRNISEDNIKAEADIEAAQLKDSGYIYINVDDGWQGGFDGN